jgi:rhodanese-related sulfurtransferase
MMYKTKAAVWFDIRTEHSTQIEHHVEFFSFKPGGTKETTTL